MKRLFLLTAAAAAAVAVLIALTIPPARIPLASAWSDGTVAGTLHVHTNRSDGRSTPEEVAAAAARAGQKFVVFTDHGDGMTKRDPPAYHSGVLCLDGVEISTTGGHYVVLNMPAAPYALGGEARDVVEDVRRLGGFGVAAHPDSPKQELRWTDWTAPFDAVELANPDTSWRVRLQRPGWRPKARLLASLFDYPFRPAETVAALIERPTENLARWDALTRRRKVVALSGVDAHAKLALRNSDPGDNRWSLALPSYEASFRVLSIHVRPDRALGGDAAADAATIVRALRAGHAYTAIDAIASPPSFEFTASNQRGTAEEGDELGADGPVTLVVRSNAPDGFSTTVWRGATALAGGGHEPAITVQAPAEPAVYWVEIRPPGPPVEPSWIISNPIYVRGPEPPTALPVRPRATKSEPMFDGKTTSGWSVEEGPEALAAVDVAPAAVGAELRLRYGLGGVPGMKQSAALVYDMPNGALGYDRLTFEARAEHPMRISVQLRSREQGRPDERWQRSVYIDAANQPHAVYFDDVTPIEDLTPGASAPAWQPNLASVRSVMFVIDTTNTRVGSSGHLWIRSAALQK